MDIHSARRWFDEHGVPISDWAAAHGFDRQIVYAVLSGRSRAIRGESHRVAVALGLKPDSKVRSPHEDPAAYAGPAGRM